MVKVIISCLFLLIYFFSLPEILPSYAQYFTPRGNFGSASCTNLIGWTCDPDNFSQSLTINVYRDGPFGGGGIYVGSAVANNNNANSTSFCGGTSNHGFIFTVPDSLKNAVPHSLYVYTHDYPAGSLFGPINGSPRSITCSLSIQGSAFSDTNLNTVWDSGESFVNIVGDVSTSPSSSISHPTTVEYLASNLSAGAYNVFLNVPPGYEPYYPNNNGNSPFYTVAVGNSCSTDTAHGSSCNAAGNIVSLRFALRQIFTINGNVYIDTNRNGVYEPGSGETGYGGGTTVYLNGGNPKTTGAAGGYLYSGVYAGNYVVELPSSSIPSGYVPTSPSQVNVTLGPSGIANFGIAPALYQISGFVFDDQNKDRLKNGAEPNMSGNYQIQITGPTNQTLTATNGVYSTGATLPEGTYTVSYTSAVPSEYNMTSPLNGPPPSFSVTVGRSCTTNGASGASCISAGYTFTASHVQNLNFGMTNYTPWFQIIGADGRIDSGFSNSIPSTASVACGGPYASINSAGSTQPGILFSGDSSFDFGSGQASPNPYNWQVGGTTAPDAAPYAGNVIRSSTQYMKTTLRQSGVTPTALSSVCTLNNCTLPANLASGTYEAAGDVTLNAYTVSANKNFVFIINGDLQINGEILVSAGSTLIISAASDIFVSSSVGEVDITSQDPNLEGFYSADESFFIQGTNNCTTGSDRRFNLAGGIVVNAGSIGGSLQNQRDLCVGDRSCPAFSIIAKPSFLLNMPDFIKYKADVWQEVAP